MKCTVTTLLCAGCNATLEFFADLGTAAPAVSTGLRDAGMFGEEGEGICRRATKECVGVRGDGKEGDDFVEVKIAD